MRRTAIAATLALVLTALAGAARAELLQQGNLRVYFDGSLAPRSLPRERLAPVSVTLDGSVTTTDHTRPPQLSDLKFAVNSAGRVSTAGLPRCGAGTLQQTSTEAALARCRQALVGRGRFAANVNFPDTPLIPAHGQVLAFNSRIRGHSGLLLHLYGSTPVRATFVLPFTISHQPGEFGTVFATHIPQLASGLGYVTDITMTLGRKYSYRGRRRSFLSAACAAPAGFRIAPFTLAHATFAFSNGQRLSTSLARDCRVRG